MARSRTPPPDPAEQTAAEQRQASGHGVAATAAVVGVSAPPVLAQVAPLIPPAVAAAAVGESAEIIIKAYIVAAILRAGRSRLAMSGLVRMQHPELSDHSIDRLVTKEMQWEKQFRAKMEQRLRKDVPEALSLRDPGERAARMAAIQERENRYVAMREQAMAERLSATVDRFDLKQESPEGALWTLDPSVKQHTLGCLAMAGKFWPWSVLDVVHPPLHPSCPCKLVGKDDAESRGWLPVPFEPMDPEDAWRQAMDAMKLEEAANRHLTTWEIEEAVRGVYEEGKHPRGRTGKWIEKLGMPERAKALAELEHKHGELWNRGEDHPLAQMHDALKSREGVDVHVARDEHGEIVGALAVKHDSPYDEGHSRIHNVGSLKKGTGTALTREAAKGAAERGKGLTGEIVPSAAGFYHKHGFRATGRSETYEIHALSPAKTKALARRKVQEAVAFEERLHPRDRLGQWMKVGRTASEVAAALTDARRRQRWHGDLLTPHDPPRDPAELGNPVASSEKWGHVYDALDGAQAENARSPVFAKVVAIHGPQAILVTDQPRAGVQQGAFSTHGDPRVVGVADRLESWIERDRNRTPLSGPVNFVSEALGLASTVRHEYGHKVETAVLTGEQRREIMGLLPVVDTPEGKRFDQDAIAHGLSGYATFGGEFIPELFALATDPQYDPASGRWPSWVVEAADRLMGYVVADYRHLSEARSPVEVTHMPVRRAALRDEWPFLCPAEPVVEADVRLSPHYLHTGGMLRWSKGTHEGGQFRPRRGGVSHPILRMIRALIPHGTPFERQQRHEARDVTIRGHRVRIPEHRTFKRIFDGHVFTSPPGSTNVYRDGMIVSTPSEPYRHADMRPRREKGVLDVAAPADPGALASIRKVLSIPSAQGVTERVETASTKLDRAHPPVQVGDKAHEAEIALVDHGWQLATADEDPTQEGLWSVTYVHPPSGSLVTLTTNTLHVDNTVVDVTWSPRRPPEPGVELGRPPNDGQELLTDTRAFIERLRTEQADRLRVFGRTGYVTQMSFDPELENAGEHGWDGHMKFATRIKDAVERAHEIRLLGEPLDDSDKRELFESVKTTTHESLHSVAPVRQVEYIHPFDKGLEESLTEELAHQYTVDRLMRSGQEDVAQWSIAHPNDIVSQGSYRGARWRLGDVLDRMKLAPELRREYLADLKFSHTPGSRGAKLRDDLAASGAFEDDLEAADYLEGMFEDPLPSGVRPMAILANDIGRDPVQAGGTAQVSFQTPEGMKVGTLLHTSVVNGVTLHDIERSDGRVELGVPDSKVVVLRDDGVAHVGTVVVRPGDLIRYDNILDGSLSEARVTRIIRPGAEGGLADYVIEARTTRNSKKPGELVYLNRERTGGVVQLAGKAGPPAAREPHAPDLPEDVKTSLLTRARQRLRELAPEAGAVAQAVQDTITTPLPGVGRSKLGDVAAWLTFALNQGGLIPADPGVPSWERDLDGLKAGETLSSEGGSITRDADDPSKYLVRTQEHQVPPVVMNREAARAWMQALNKAERRRRQRREQGVILRNKFGEEAFQEFLARRGDTRADTGTLKKASGGIPKGARVTVLQKQGAGLIVRWKNVQKLVGGRDVVFARADPGSDYRGGHTAPGDSYFAPMHDLGQLMPEDVYDPRVQAQYYGTGEALADRQSFEAVNAAKGKPDAMIRVYRALPGEHKAINDGDWVTPSRLYAEQHMIDEPDWHIVSAEVSASKLYWDGSSINEWGYNGPSIGEAEKPPDLKWRKVSQGMHPPRYETDGQQGMYVVEKGTKLWSITRDAPKFSGRGRFQGQAKSLARAKALAHEIDTGEWTQRRENMIEGYAGGQVSLGWRDPPTMYELWGGDPGRMSQTQYDRYRAELMNLHEHLPDRTVREQTIRMSLGEAIRRGAVERMKTSVPPRADPGAGPKIVRVTQVEDHPWAQNPRERVPLVYVPAKNTIYVGPGGSHHVMMREPLGLGEETGDPTARFYEASLITRSGVPGMERGIHFEDHDVREMVPPNVIREFARAYPEMPMFNGFGEPMVATRADPGAESTRGLGPFAGRKVEFSEVHGAQTTTRIFVAHVGPMPLGALSVDEKRGTIENVNVQDGFRRMGVATALLEAARKATGLPLTEDTGERSPSGQAFAKKMGLGSKLLPDEMPTDLTEREGAAYGARMMIGIWGTEWTPVENAPDFHLPDVPPPADPGTAVRTPIMADPVLEDFPTGTFTPDRKMVFQADLPVMAQGQGTLWKGMQNGDGPVVIWTVNTHGFPHHRQMAEALGWVPPRNENFVKSDSAWNNGDFAVWSGYGTTVSSFYALYGDQVQALKDERKQLVLPLVRSYARQLIVGKRADPGADADPVVFPELPDVRHLLNDSQYAQTWEPMLGYLRGLDAAGISWSAERGGEGLHDWLAKSPAVPERRDISPSVAEGSTLQEVLQNMGAYELDVNDRRRPDLFYQHPKSGWMVRNDLPAPRVMPAELGPTGRGTQPPRVHDIVPGPGGFGEQPVPGSERTPPHVFRAISEDEWHNIQQTGLIQTHGQMNLSQDEGVVTALTDPSWYLPGALASDKPGTYNARIIRITLRPEDGWTLDRDGYVKTRQSVPADRIDMVSPPLVRKRGVRVTAGGSEMPDVGDYRVATPRGEGTPDLNLGSWIDLPDPKIDYRDTVGEVSAGDHTFPVRYLPNKKNEASFQTDKIEVGPKFYDLPPAGRRNIIVHEIAHSFDSEMMKEHPWTMDPGEWADADGAVLNGPASDAGERISDAYAALNDPAWRKDMERWPAIRRVGEYALAHGYPVHPDAASELAGAKADPGARASVEVPAAWPEQGVAWNRRWDALPPDTQVVLFHATDRVTAEQMVAHGIDPADKPWSLGRRRYEAGEPAVYQPGAGLAAGLTVGYQPWAVDGYGREMLAVRVRKGDVEVPPEQASLGETRSGGALRVNDAHVRTPIPPEDVQRLEMGGRVSTPATLDQLAEKLTAPSAKADPGVPQVNPDEIARARELRGLPGQGTQHSRTTTPVDGLTGHRDALMIQADETFAGNPAWKQLTTLPSGARDTHEAIQTYDNWTRKRLTDLTSAENGNKVAVRLRDWRLRAMLDEGSVRNAHHGVTPGHERENPRGPTYLPNRAEYERRTFGITSDHPDDHPVYGYVGRDNELLDKSIARAFGDIKLTLKDEVRPRTTVTYSDSMFIGGVDRGAAVPSPIDAPSELSVASWMNLRGVERSVIEKGYRERPYPEAAQKEFDKWLKENLAPLPAHKDAHEWWEIRRDEAHDKIGEKYGWDRWSHGDFIETQIHGGVRWSDVERVDFENADQATPDITGKLDELGVPWTVGGPGEVPAKADPGTGAEAVAQAKALLAEGAPLPPERQPPGLRMADDLLAPMTAEPGSVYERHMQKVIDVGRGLDAELHARTVDDLAAADERERTLMGDISLIEPQHIDAGDAVMNEAVERLRLWVLGEYGFDMSVVDAHNSLWIANLYRDGENRTGVTTSFTLREWFVEQGLDRIGKSWDAEKAATEMVERLNHTADGEALARTGRALYEARNELMDVRKAPAQIRARAALALLSEVREMGPDDSVQLRYSKTSKKKARELVDWSLRMFPRDWLRKVSDDSLDLYATTVRRRGHFDPATKIANEWVRRIRVSSPQYSVAVHEMGHYMERLNPQIGVQEWAFWHHRKRLAEGNPLGEVRQLKRISPKSRYKDDEYALEDNFTSPYSGKVYHGHAGQHGWSWELLSMGVEDLATNRHKMLVNDPEYRAWLLGVLATV